MTSLKDDLKEMMKAWSKIEQAAKKQFPNATEAEIYQITKGAMNYAIGNTATNNDAGND